MSDPKVVVIGGPSGSGKSTLIAGLSGEPRVRLAVSATTRAPRPGEREGVDYHFLDREAFAALRESGGLLEWAEVHRNFYGTPRAELTSRGPGDCMVILDVDVQGRRNLVRLGIPHRSIFIAPPTLQTLEERLRARGTETEEVLRLRLERAAADLDARDEYDHVVVNQRVEESLQALRRLLDLDRPCPRDVNQPARSEQP